MLKDVERILIDEKELDEITSRLADKINHDYKNSDKPLILLIILKGSLVFASDLMKKINLPLELEFMKVSSYGAGTKTSGEIKIHLNLMRDHLEQYDLLIIEDIVDSGRTLSRLMTVYMAIIGVLTLIGCFNLAAVSFAERKSHFASLHMLGISKKELARMIISEGIIAFFVIVTVSLICSTVMTSVLDSAFTSFGYSLY